MKYISIVLAFLIAAAGLTLVGCQRAEEKKTEERVQRNQTGTQDGMSLEEEIAEIERQAEETRKQLIESLSENASSPDSIRGLDGESVNLNRTEAFSETTENREV